MDGEQLRLRYPFLVVGIGGAGGKLAREAAQALRCDCLKVSCDERDLDDTDSSIKIDTEGWVNPSVNQIRWFAKTLKRELKSRVSSHNTIFVVSNLAGKNGAALGPVVCSLAKEAGATVISIAIMPFGHEKDRIFSSGLALKRIRQASDSTIIADNDAFSENNPDISVPDCLLSVNRSIMHVVGSLDSHELSKEASLVCAGGHTDSETSLQASVSMAFRDAGEGAIKRAVIYVENPGVSLGELRRLNGFAEGMLSELGGTQVEIARTSSGGDSVHLLASGLERARFDRYDPLADLIPPVSVLDWDEPECSISVQLPLHNIG